MQTDSEKDDSPPQRESTPLSQIHPRLSPLNVDIPSAMDIDPEPTFETSDVMDTGETTSANDAASALPSTPPPSAHVVDMDVQSPPSPLSPLPEEDEGEPDITEDALRLDEEQRVKAQSLGSIQVDLSGLPDWATRAYDELARAGYGSSMMCILHDWAWLEACFIAVSVKEMTPEKI